MWQVKLKWIMQVGNLNSTHERNINCTYAATLCEQYCLSAYSQATSNGTIFKREMLIISFLRSKYSNICVTHHVH